jgi:hypothetical protein
MITSYEELCIEGIQKRLPPYNALSVPKKYQKGKERLDIRLFVSTLIIPSLKIQIHDTREAVARARLRCGGSG